MSHDENDDDDDDDDTHIRKIDFTSPPMTLTWIDLEAVSPPSRNGIMHRIKRKLYPSQRPEKQSQQLLKGGKNLQVSCKQKHIRF